MRRPWPSMLAPSGAIRSVTRSNIGAVCRACISPATRRAATRTDTTGAGAGRRRDERQRPSSEHHGGGVARWCRHPAVAEAAVVGKPHEITGQAVCCFVTLKQGDWDHKQARRRAADMGGAFHRSVSPAGRGDVYRWHFLKPAAAKLCAACCARLLPQHGVTGDVTTLEDMTVISRLASQKDED